MSRIPQIDPANATGRSKQLLDAVQAKLGTVPNLVRVLANAPHALEGYLNFSAALAGGVLSARVREQVSVAVAQSNACDYCLSAHSFLGAKAGLSDHDLLNARQAIGVAGKDDAVLKLALSVVVQRGEVSDAALKNARDGGLNDAEIVETVANVALNLFTNYLNHVAQTVVDFPEVKSGDLSRRVEAPAAATGR